MASLSDIPLDLLLPNKRGQFLNWIAEQYIPMSAKREIMGIWSQQMMQTFTRPEWQYVENHGHTTTE
jgi:hypothetical protein